MAVIVAIAVAIAVAFAVAIAVAIAKLGSHGRKATSKVMAITNRNGKGDPSNPVRGIGYLDTCKYPAG